MAKSKKEFLLARRTTDDIIKLPDINHPEYDIIVDYIENNYPDDIIGCLIPEGYKLAAVLIHDDPKNSRNDVWDFIIFDVTDDIGEGIETITLDNLDALDEMESDEDAKQKIVVIKKISGYYEEIIQESIGVIKKYKGKGN